VPVHAGLKNQSELFSCLKKEKLEIIMVVLGYLTYSHQTVNIFLVLKKNLKNSHQGYKVQFNHLKHMNTG
jgi:hypothetical protein